MKESIGQAFVTNLILVFTGIGLLLLIASVSYSNAYKAKNRIIYIIEKNQGYTDEAQYEIFDNLAKGNYSTIDDGNFNYCNKYLNGGTNVYPSSVVGSTSRSYKYCVIQYNGDYGDYYKVVTFMKFDIPFVGGLLEFPVKGETRSMLNTIE